MLNDDPQSRSNPDARGRQLVILEEAADYIMLSKAERDLPEWQAAGEALIMAAERRGPLLHARVGMLRALNRNVERVFNPDRRDTHWGKRKPGAGLLRASPEGLIIYARV